MTKLVRDRLEKCDHLFPGEREVIIDALKAGERFGYGNVMAWLATEWAVHLRDTQGLDEKTAIDAVSNRGPYLLPPQATPEKETKP